MTEHDLGVFYCRECGKKTPNRPIYPSTTYKPNKYCSNTCRRKHQMVTPGKIIRMANKDGACWTLPLCTNPGGYPLIRSGNKLWIASRYIWTHLNGAIPKDMIVCHHCDNPKCINPEHLFLGTHLDNSHDSIKKSRHSHGERNGNNKLTDDLVRRIREEYIPYHREFSSYSLAKKYGVHHVTIRDACNRITWGHVV